MKIKSISVMFVIMLIANILFSQNVTIKATLLNNTAAKVELRSAYDKAAPVYATTDIKGDVVTIKAEIPKTDLYAAVFDGKAQFLMCLKPGDKMDVTIDVANPQRVPAVSGSKSVLFSKQLTDLLYSRQDFLDSLNREVQHNAVQLHFSDFLTKFRPYSQSAQEADADVISALEKNDTLVKLMEQCGNNGVISKKSMDLFFTEAVKNMKLLKNYYATFNNHLETVVPNYDFSNLKTITGYDEFYKNLSVYNSSVSEHNALITSLLKDYCSILSDLVSQYDSQFYDGKLDAPKAKLNYCNAVANAVNKYGFAASQKKSDIEANARVLKTLSNNVAKEAQGSIENVVASYQKQFNNKSAEITEASRKLMLENKSDLTTLMFIDNFAQDKSLQTEIITALHEAYPEHPLVEDRYNKINNPQFRTSEGSMAPDLAFSDPDGKVRKLSDLRGKVVLVDFWASWCGPCRKENPHVRAMYEKYHDRGFEVFSVSLDNNKDRWKDAIAKDNLSWPNHVSDLKGWGSAAAKLYGVNSIPSTFLVDKDGRIIAKGLRGEQLTAVLEQIFGK